MRIFASRPMRAFSELHDHRLIPVPVNSGQVTQRADPADFYAAEGTFPPFPIP